MKKAAQLMLSFLLGFMFICTATPTMSYADDQVHMEKALDLLQNARNQNVGEGKVMNLKAAQEQLEKATANKGGHRMAAIDFIQKALNQIEKGKIDKANEDIDKAIEQVKKGIAAGSN